MNVIEMDQIHSALFLNQKDKDSKKELINLSIECETLFDSFSGLFVIKNSEDNV